MLERTVFRGGGSGWRVTTAWEEEENTGESSAGDDAAAATVSGVARTPVPPVVTRRVCSADGSVL